MLTYDLQAGDQPKYYRLYTCIREDILRAELLPGQKLPSKRALAEHLHISLATVSGAYEQLVDEGYLAAKAGIEAIGGRYRNLLDSRMRILFTGDSMASSDWIALCRLLEGHDFCLLLLSSEGVELEMCAASRALRWLMERRYGQSAKERVYVSARQGSGLAVMAKEEGFTFLPMDSCLGGGASALNAGTLLVMAAAGIDPLGVLEGAAEGFSQYDLRAFENPVWMYAGARYALTQKGRSAEILGCFTPDFGGLRNAAEFLAVCRCLFPSWQEEQAGRRCRCMWGCRGDSTGSTR